MIQLGQAAGTAAAIAKQLSTDLPNVPPHALRDALRKQHVQPDHPMSRDVQRHLLDEQS
jgi:hypothetical protein